MARRSSILDQGQGEVKEAQQVLDKARRRISRHLDSDVCDALALANAALNLAYRLVGKARVEAYKEEQEIEKANG